MIHWILAMISIAAGGGNPAGKAITAPDAAAPTLTETALQAEPQTPTGKFTTAIEVKPILAATQGNWVALRDYDGQDLLYFTHLLAWRCGLLQINWAVNDGPLQPWPMPACHEGTATPNAITAEDGLPFIALPQGSVSSVSVELVFDDLTRDEVRFERGRILMP